MVKFLFLSLALYVGWRVVNAIFWMIFHRTLLLLIEQVLGKWAWGTWLWHSLETLLTSHLSPYIQVARQHVLTTTTTAQSYASAFRARVGDGMTWVQQSYLTISKDRRWMIDTRNSNRNVTQYASPLSVGQATMVVGQTVYLSRLALAVLPISSMMLFTQRSIESAINVLPASEFSLQDALTAAFQHLYDDVKDFRGALNEYDMKVRTMLWQVTENLNQAKRSMANSLNSGPASSFHRGSWTGLHYVALLTILAWTMLFHKDPRQSHLSNRCYMVPAYATAALLMTSCRLHPCAATWEVCQVLRQTWPSQHLEAEDNLPDALDELYLTLDRSLQPLYWLAQGALDSSAEVAHSFGEVERLLYQTEHQVSQEKARLQASALESGGFWAQLRFCFLGDGPAHAASVHSEFGGAYSGVGATKGLSLEQKEVLITLDGQVKHLSTIISARHNAIETFETAIAVLRQMEETQQDLRRTIDQWGYLNRQKGDRKRRAASMSDHETRATDDIKFQLWDFARGLSNFICGMLLLEDRTSYSQYDIVDARRQLETIQKSVNTLTEEGSYNQGQRKHILHTAEATFLACLKHTREQNEAGGRGSEGKWRNVSWTILNS